VSSVALKRSRFGLSIGSIFASFIIIGGIQVLIAGLRPPISSVVTEALNWIASKASAGTTPLRAVPTQWSLVIENLVMSALFVACGLGLGSWLRRDRG
jgi:hypothetical protein